MEGFPANAAAGAVGWLAMRWSAVATLCAGWIS